MNKEFLTNIKKTDVLDALSFLIFPLGYFLFFYYLKKDQEKADHHLKFSTILPIFLINYYCIPDLLTYLFTFFHAQTSIKMELSLIIDVLLVGGWLTSIRVLNILLIEILMVYLLLI